MFGCFQVSKVLYESFGRDDQDRLPKINHLSDEEEGEGVLYHQVPRPDYHG